MFLLALTVMLSGVALLMSPWLQEDEEKLSVLVGALLTVQLAGTFALSAAILWKEFN